MSTRPRELLVETAAAILVGAGVAPRDARTVGEALVEADARGIASHGLMLVPMYVERLVAGSVVTRSEAEVVLDAGAVAVLDAHHALGILTADQAMTMALAKAHSYGVGVVAVRHAFHFGGAFRYAAQAAAAGRIGIVAANTRPLMPAPGGATAVVGNNPIAIGVPGDDPILLDMALSEAALGKIRLAEAEGRSIPATWASDADGAPTTDPTQALAGLLLPTGGPKGYGLALLVDVLTGVLAGGGFGSGVRGLYADTSLPNDCAHLFIALDPAAFGSSEDFRARTEALVAQVRASRLAPGVEAVLLPGQRESDFAAGAYRDGVPVEDSVIDGLASAASRVGVLLPEELTT